MRQPSKTNTIGIVTVLYQSATVLNDFYRSLDRQTGCDFRLYVVDNCSPDDSVEVARQLSETVHFESVLISNSVNGGIAQGNNRGIRAARADGCDWIVLANNDTVWEPGVLQELLTASDLAAASMAVPKILIHGTDRIWSAGGAWNRLRGGTRHIGVGQPDGKLFDQQRTIAYAPTCMMLIRSEVFGRVGMMDERFFIYYDDSDFVRRATRAGEALLYVPTARISHKESVSTGGVSPLAQYYLSKNLLLFTEKHFSIAYWLYVLLVNLLILFTKRVFTFSRAQWWASWRGYRDGVGACFQRSESPKLREVCPD